MADFNDNSIAGLLLAEKINSLGHMAIGNRGRRYTNVMLAVSALLGYAAGFSGLTNLVGKTWVGLIALAAGLSTAAVILLLTTLKPNDHLRAGAAYQDIYLRTVQQGLNDDNLWRLQDEFRKTAADTNKDGIGLSLSAIRKFREAARSELRQEPELPALDDRSAIDRATLPEERS